MSTGRPRTDTSPKALLRADSVALSIRCRDIDRPDLSLVIDVYDLDNPVHPEGHVGWWKFPLEPGMENRIAELVVGSPRWSATVDGETAVDSWTNPEPTDPRHLLVIIVLRSNATNAIVHLERIPIMASQPDLDALQNVVDRDWTQPALCVAPFVFDPDETIHLVAPNINTCDAVGNLCFDVYRLLRQNGVPVRLYATTPDLGLADLVESQLNLPDQEGPQDQILYFYSTDDPEISSVARCRCRKTLYFHGITDPLLLRVFDPELAMTTERAWRALAQLDPFDRYAANSVTTARALAQKIGRPFGDILVVPPAIRTLSPTATGPARSETPRLLAVGQLSPHKKLEDVLRLFAAFRELEPEALCAIVGRPRSRAYRDYLEWVQREELSLPDGAVEWLGVVAPQRLAELYQTSTALISMSEDEGFCLPIFESMQYGLPVFAFTQPAVLETLGSAGMSFRHKAPAHLARNLRGLVNDAQRRERVIAEGRERAAVLAHGMNGRAFFELLRR